MESEESRFQEGVRKSCHWNKISVNLNKNSTRHGHSWKRKVFKMCNDPHCWNSLGLLLFKNLWVPFSTETTDRAHFEANIHWRDVKMGCITSHNVCGHSWAVCSWTWSLTTRMMEKNESMLGCGRGYTPCHEDTGAKSIRVKLLETSVHLRSGKCPLCVKHKMWSYVTLFLSFVTT